MSSRGKICASCRDCAIVLLKKTKELDENVPLLNLPLSSIIEPYIREGPRDILELIHSIDDIVENAINSLSCFSERQPINVLNNNRTHRQGRASQPEKYASWMTEAARTGEEFPGRPEVRPRIDFGRTMKKRIYVMPKELHGSL